MASIGCIGPEFDLALKDPGPGTELIVFGPRKGERTPRQDPGLFDNGDKGLWLGAGAPSIVAVSAQKVTKDARDVGAGDTWWQIPHNPLRMKNEGTGLLCVAGVWQLSFTLEVPPSAVYPRVRVMAEPATYPYERPREAAAYANGLSTKLTQWGETLTWPVTQTVAPQEALTLYLNAWVWNTMAVPVRFTSATVAFYGFQAPAASGTAVNTLGQVVAARPGKTLDQLAADPGGLTLTQLVDTWNQETTS